MCFTVLPGTKLLKASRDIICYKVMERDKKRKGHWCSFFKSFLYQEGFEYEELDTKDLEYPIRGMWQTQVEVGLHSFSTLKEARSANMRGNHIVECYIPKGSIYRHNKKDKEYVSNRIVIVEEYQPKTKKK